MSIVVDVGLISGKTVSVEAGLNESVGSLKRHAQTALAVGKGRLLDSSARLLDEKQTVKKAKLQTGSLLALQVGRVQVHGTAGSLFEGAFSAVLGDGSVVVTAVLCKIS